MTPKHATRLILIRNITVLQYNLHVLIINIFQQRIYYIYAIHFYKYTSKKLITSAVKCYLENGRYVGQHVIIEGKKSDMKIMLQEMKIMSR